MLSSIKDGVWFDHTDQCNTCTKAIHNFLRNPDIDKCGCNDQYSKGNGSLMRILPACLFYYEKQKKDGLSNKDAIEGIHVISGLTHIEFCLKCGVRF